MATETLSLTDLRPRLSAAIDRAHDLFDRFVITRHGRAEAVLLGADDYEGLLETLQILSDRETVQRLLEAEEDFGKGEAINLETLRRDLESGSGD